jgi:nucleoid-associated protein YgaU
MERVAFLIEETGERIACLLNPESVVMRRAAGVRPRRSIGGGSLTGAELADDALLFTGGGMTEMFLNLLFDVALTDQRQAAAKVEDVRSLTSPLWKLAENSGATARNYGEPPRVRFVWGKSWNIPGVVASVSERLDYFDRAGTPLRSWLRMRFLRVVEPLAETTAKAPPLPPAAVNATLAAPTAPETPTAPTPPTPETPSREVRIHTYAAGERLDQLVRRQYGFYGHPSLWRLIASYNNISDPLNIPAGTVLQFPPLSVLENKQ